MESLPSKICKPQRDVFNIETLGEAMRPKRFGAEQRALEREQERFRTQLRLSREERDYVAGHALDSVNALAISLQASTNPDGGGTYKGALDDARKIAALSNLLGDIGWEREATGAEFLPTVQNTWTLGELFPVAQLRPWLEEWQRQDNEALLEVERSLEVDELSDDRNPHGESILRATIAEAQTKLGTGAILLTRIEKWMASHEN